MQNLLFELKDPQRRSILSNFSFFQIISLQFLLLGLFSSSEILALSPCETPLETKIEAIISQPHLKRTRWGIDIQKTSKKTQEMPDTRAKFTSLFKRNAQQFFLPASTAKLFTSTALAQTLESDYRIETPYFGKGALPNLKELRIVGQGDPSILSPQLIQIAQDLRNQGVRSIDTLIGDASHFGEPRIVPSWEWEDLQTSDGVPITSLSFSQNSLPLQLSPRQVGQSLKFKWLDGKPLAPLIIENLSTTVPADQPEFIQLERNLAGTSITIKGQLRVGASPDVSYVAIAYPIQYFLHRLRSALQKEGIQVKNLKISSSFDDTKKSNQKKLGTLFSPPISELLKTINQSSNNYYTESLLRHLAWTQSTNQSITPQGSVRLLKQTLQPLNIKPEEYFLKDASGLSRQNLVSPESLTSTLKAILNWQATGETQKFLTLKESLATPGQAGTLKRRFKNTPVVGKLFAKTGTLSGTVTLVGFLEGPDQSTVVLSLMANQSNQATSVLRQAIDDMVLQIAQTQTCSSTKADAQTNPRKSLYNLKS